MKTPLEAGQSPRGETGPWESMGRSAKEKACFNISDTLHRLNIAISTAYDWVDFGLHGENGFNY